MVIACNYNNGEVFQHYGKTKVFKLYTVEDNKVVSSKLIDCGEYSHETLAVLLKNNGVSVLICGNLGNHALESLNNANIKIYNGNTGNCDDRVKDYLDGKLSFDPKATHMCHHS